VEYGETLLLSVALLELLYDADEDKHYILVADLDGEEERMWEMTDLMEWSRLTGVRA
jgi:hypothetical protein